MPSQYSPIADRPDLVKDTSTGAILNKDVNALAAYKKRKANMQRIEDDINENKNNLDKIESKVDKIESDIGEIKSLLTQLIGKLDK